MNKDIDNNIEYLCNQLNSYVNQDISNTINYLTKPKTNKLEILNGMNGRFKELTEKLNDIESNVYNICEYIMSMINGDEKIRNKIEKTEEYRKLFTTIEHYVIKKIILHLFDYTNYNTQNLNFENIEKKIFNDIHYYYTFDQQDKKKFREVVFELKNLNNYIDDDEFIYDFKNSVENPVLKLLNESTVEMVLTYIYVPKIINKNKEIVYNGRYRIRVYEREQLMNSLNNSQISKKLLLREIDVLKYYYKNTIKTLIEENNNLKKELTPKSENTKKKQRTDLEMIPIDEGFNIVTFNEPI